MPLDETVAAVMMTNPNTLGLFERNIPEIARLAHEAGALMYYDPHGDWAGTVRDRHAPLPGRNPGRHLREV